MGVASVERTWTVERRSDASRIARGLVTEALEDVAAPSTVANASLLTSELVTNVMMHTEDERTVVALHFDPAEQLVRVGVTDYSPTLLPTILPARPPGIVGGFGLKLVAGLADAWGSDLGLGCKTVWFQLGCADA
jgi:anti-sigma regulatory factor (Ser/Thr protein kinase)